MPTVLEHWNEYAFTGSHAAIRTVFAQLPATMQRIVAAAANRPDQWLSYGHAETMAGVRAGSFAKSFGGYHSKDAARPRPFHIGIDENKRFYLLVDHKQAAAIGGS